MMVLLVSGLLTLWLLGGAFENVFSINLSQLPSELVVGSIFLEVPLSSKGGLLTFC